MIDAGVLEAIKAVVTGIVAGGGSFLLLGRMYLTKIDKNAKAIEELEPRVTRVEDQSKNDKSELLRQLEGLTETMKTMTATVARLAEDVAYLRGAADGSKASPKKR